jgi:hypothetical protein
VTPRGSKLVAGYFHKVSVNVFLPYLWTNVGLIDFQHRKTTISLRFRPKAAIVHTSIYYTYTVHILYIFLHVKVEN